MNTHIKFQEASFIPSHSWFGIFTRALAKWANLVRGPRGRRPRAPRWYDSDGVHRGF
jgi:hypothetical protein